MYINEHGEKVYTQEEAREIRRSLPNSGGQSTSRSLIDCINVFACRCPMDEYAICTTVTRGRINLSYIYKGTELIFQTTDAPNIQCAYEELLEFIIEKAFPQ